jgi:hypothetical protein
VAEKVDGEKKGKGGRKGGRIGDWGWGLTRDGRENGGEKGAGGRGSLNVDVNK